MKKIDIQTLDSLASCLSATKALMGKGDTLQLDQKLQTAREQQATAMQLMRGTAKTYNTIAMHTGLPTRLYLTQEQQNSQPFHRVRLKDAAKDVFLPGNQEPDHRQAIPEIAKALNFLFQRLKIQDAELKARRTYVITLSKLLDSLQP